MKKKYKKKSSWQNKGRRKVRAFIDSLKTGSCVDCGQKFPPYIMQFDHKGDKKYTVSRMRNHSKDLILEEVAKCDLVCANCHATRTYVRRVDERVDTQTQ